MMALETIAQDRPAEGPSDLERQEFDNIMAGIRNRSDDNYLDAQDSPPSLDLPVGLENLRNTCYLNSILQYFFSVTAVRELALRCSNQPSLPSTQGSVVEILQRLGLPNLPPGRAFLANHCEFAQNPTILTRKPSLPSFPWPCALLSRAIRLISS